MAVPHPLLKLALAVTKPSDGKTVPAPFKDLPGGQPRKTMNAHRWEGIKHEFRPGPKGSGVVNALALTGGAALLATPLFPVVGAYAGIKALRGSKRGRTAYRKENEGREKQAGDLLKLALLARTSR